MLALKRVHRTQVYQSRIKTEMRNIKGGKWESRHILVCLGLVVRL